MPTPFAASRAVHLLDIENLVGAARPALRVLTDARVAYEEQVHVGARDLVFIACNHGLAVDVHRVWPGSRPRVRSGPDGADHALLDVLFTEPAVARSAEIIIASGDGIFAEGVARLIGSGHTVSVVSRPEALARRLRMAAGGRVTHFNLYKPVPTIAAQPLLKGLA